MWKKIEMEFLHRLEIPEKPERIFTFTRILAHEDDDSLELNVHISHPFDDI